MIRALKEIGADYLVGGSLASSFHGTPRSTHDVDLVADLKPAHATLLAARLEGRYYVDAGRILTATLRRSSFNVILTPSRSSSRSYETRTSVRALTLLVILAIIVGIPALIYAVHIHYLPVDLVAEKVMNRLGVRW